MRFLIAAAALALTAASAQAQLGQSQQISGANAIGQHAQQASDRANKEQEAKVKANDNAYNSALRNLPDKQYDPWHGVR